MLSRRRKKTKLAYEAYMRGSGCGGRCCHAVDCIETPSPRAEVRNPKPGHGHDTYISCVSPARIRLRENQGGKSQQNEATHEWMNAAFSYKATHWRLLSLEEQCQKH